MGKGKDYIDEINAKTARLNTVNSDALGPTMLTLYNLAATSLSQLTSLATKNKGGHKFTHADKKKLSTAETALQRLGV
jgi:hypothetical protein